VARGRGGSTFSCVRRSERCPADPTAEHRSLDFRSPLHALPTPIFTGRGEPCTLGQPPRPGPCPSLRRFEASLAVVPIEAQAGKARSRSRRAQRHRSHAQASAPSVARSYRLDRRAPDGTIATGNRAGGLRLHGRGLQLPLISTSGVSCPAGWQRLSHVLAILNRTRAVSTVPKRPYRQATEAITGTAQPTVPLKPLRRFKVPVPPLKAPSRIADVVETLLQRCGDLETVMHQKDARATALAKALVGSVVSPQPVRNPI
jgi:hypothetical protein